MSYLLSSFETWIAALVHENAHFSPVDRTRHATFIVVRLATSLVTLAAVPPVLAFSGAPTIWETLGFGFLMLPLVAVALLSWTGKMIVAQTICFVALVGLSLTIAISSGLLGRRARLADARSFRSGLHALANHGDRQWTAAMLAILSFVGLHAFGILVDPAQGSVLTTALFVAPAVAYATGLAHAGIRLHNLGRDEERRGAARYRNLADAVGDLVLRHDRSGAVLFASRESETLFGLSPRELMGRGFFEHIHVADRPAFLKTIAEAARSSETVTATLRLRRSSTPSGQASSKSRYSFGSRCARVNRVERKAARSTKARSLPSCAT